MKKQKILLAILALPFFSLQAQNLYVLPTNAGQKSYSLSEVKEITFANRTIYIADKTDTLEQLPLADLFYLSFTDYSNVGVADYELRNANYVIYPNPTTGQLRITNYELRNWTLSGAEVEIFSIVGQVVFVSRLSEFSPETTIDISRLHAGIYFLKITEWGRGGETFKIIKY